MLLAAGDLFQWRRRPYCQLPPVPALYEADDVRQTIDRMRVRGIGFGCSHYTFQNCPRLTDKLLGQLGASRRVQRAEVDEIDADAGDVSKQKWSDAVAKVIKSGKAAAANVCDWTQPGDTILDKHDEMLVAAATGGPPPLLFIGAALAVVAAVYFVKSRGKSPLRRRRRQDTPAPPGRARHAAVADQRWCTRRPGARPLLFDPCTRQNHQPTLWVPIFIRMSRSPTSSFSS